MKKSESNNEKFKRLFLSICEIKKFVSILKGKDLENYKMVFYNQDFPNWRLDMLWEYISGDVEYSWIKKVFEDKQVI